MPLKSSKSLTLLELLISIAVLSGAIVFVFRGLTAALVSFRFSQNITIACYLAEEKLFEIEEKQKNSPLPLPQEEGQEELQGRKFNWVYRTKELPDSGLVGLDLIISWREKAREKEYTISFPAYLLPRKQ